MQKKFVSRDAGQSRRLVLFFAGWGMDWRPFRSLHMPGYDVVVVWNYSDLTFSWRPFMSYDEVCLVAWGMGVFAAAQTVHELMGRITCRIAVNGTLHPISDTMGIPQSVVQGMFNQLSPGWLKRFYSRMCGSPEQFDWFMANRPQRTVADITDELREIETQTIFHAPLMDSWDLAVVSREDVIVDVRHQVKAWHGVVPIRFIDGGHLPDFASLLPTLLIDKESLHTDSGSGDNLKVKQQMANQLMARYKRTAHHDSMVGNIVEIARDDNTLTTLVTAELLPASRLERWSLDDETDPEVRMRRVPSATLSVVFMSDTLHWMNSPAAFLQQCARTLADGGHVVLATFVRGIEQGQVLGFDTDRLPTIAGWRAMVPADFEVMVCETATVTDTVRPAYIVLRKTET